MMIVGQGAATALTLINVDFGLPGPDLLGLL